MLMITKLNKTAQNRTKPDATELNSTTLSTAGRAQYNTTQNEVKMQIEIKNYTWTAGARIRADPNVIGREIDRLSNGHGNISVETYIENARNKNSPLYNTITHDPNIALEQWNKHEARHVLECIRVINVETKQPERPIINVSERHGTYTKVEVIKSDPDLRKIALKNALRELKAFREKYKEIKELMSVITEIDKLVRENT